MRVFEYIVKDEVGIHARPAGMLVKEAMKHNCKIIVKTDNKSADATRLMAIMGLGIKKGQKIQIEITGEEENEVYESIKEFFEKNL